ncbi:hypothetical protein AB0L00_14270 [Actinoallomurus sp. NPDC052308]|uniref:hypothetical protein n=1 Tax=Actinoallomurus sp. NPDC052308 TaxID=3155530 RepID=UPI00342BCDFA
MTHLSGGPVGTMRAGSGMVLRRRFPGLVFWYGLRTRSWWAMVRVSQGWRLVEAVDADELTQAVLMAATWPYPPARRPALAPKRSGHFGSAFDKKGSSMGISDKWRGNA